MEMTVKVKIMINKVKIKSNHDPQILKYYIIDYTNISDCYLSTQ